MTTLLLLAFVLLDILVFYSVKKLSLKKQIIILLLFFGYFVLSDYTQKYNNWIALYFLPFFVIFFCNWLPKLMGETLFEKKLGFSIIKTFCNEYFGLIIILAFHIQVIIQLIA